jgi:hypothetical protein
MGRTNARGLLLAAFLVPACDKTATESGPSTGTPTPDLCDSSAAPENCGMSCNDDDQCGAGLYCSGDGVCHAECSADYLDACAETQVCNQQGFCVAPGDSDGDGDPDECPSVVANLDPVIPTVVLLIDGSGSMLETFGTTDRWNAVKSALTNPTTGVINQLQDRIPFGASIYNSLGGNSGGTCPILSSDAPALNNAADIGSLLNAFSPAADTPTAESITVTAANFPASDGPRIIILATDGDPDSCVNSDDHGPTTKAASEAATQAAYNMGIETFVLSVGNDVTASHLQRLANAGQGQPLASGTVPYYVANNPTELVNGLNSIIRGARTCDFIIDQPINMTQANNGNVQLNGQPLQFGTDWQLNGPTELELLGDACNTFLDTDDVNLTAVFPCNVVIL